MRCPPWKFGRLALLLAVLSSGGCERAEEPVFASPSDVARYATLPGLQQVHHRPLQQELARLRAEQATPDQFSDVLPPQAAADLRQRNDAAAALAIFPASQHAAWNRELDDVLLRGPFDVGRRWQTAQQLLDRHAERRKEFEQLLARPSLAFGIPLCQGLAADLTAIEAVQLGNRHLLLDAALQLEHNNLELAADRLRLLFDAAAGLAEANHPLPRAAATHARRQACELMRQIVLHPHCHLELLNLLLEDVQQQLAAWPHDRRAWLGDRVAGLITYELVRDGYLLSLLHYAEIRILSNEIGIAELGTAVQRNLDYDQHFYLAAMRSMIAACEHDFPARRRAWRKIEQQLKPLRDSPRHPFVADHLLLSDVLALQRLQVLDRARLLAWQLALTTARGLPAENAPNPLTGLPFILEAGNGRVLVDGIDPENNEPPVIVPLSAA